MQDSFTLIDAGLMPYSEALALQQQLHSRVVDGDDQAYLMLVQHPPVLTLGKHATRENLLFSEDFYRAAGIDVVRTDRGGEVTAHEPGQLVCYPIFRLSDYQLTPRSYVAALETAVIEVLAQDGIKASTDPDAPGVWLGREKICAIGVRIAQRATLHGLALNVANDLSLFNRIVPCGLQGRGVTSLSRVLGVEVAVETVAPRLVAALAQQIFRDRPSKSSPDLQWGHGVSTI